MTATETLPRRAAILARISDARNGDEHGVDGQVGRARELAARLGWGVGPEPSHVVIENDTSAFQRKKIRLPDGRSVLRTVRPGFRAVLDMLASGEADGLVAVHLDRVARDPRDLEDLIDTVESRSPRIPVESVTGSLRLANDSDVMTARVMVAVSNESSRATGRRVRDGRELKARAGSYGGGRRPYGYALPPRQIDPETGKLVRGRLVLVPEEAEEIRRAADQLLVGVSLREITRDLRERGVPTVKGGQWEAGTLRTILLKPSVAGLAVSQRREAARQHRAAGRASSYDDGIVGSAQWEPILPEPTWRAVAQKLSDPKRRTSPGNTPRHLGSLLYQCGICAANGVEQTVCISAGRHSYTCRGLVSHLRRSAGPVDAFVTDLLLRRLARPGADALLVRPAQPDTDMDTAEAARDLATQRELETQLAEAFAEQAISFQQLRAGSERIHARIRELEASLVRTEEKSPLEGIAGREDAARIWAGRPLGHQRAILRTMMDVTLLKGKPGRRPDGSYFDPKSVRIDWKQ
jgi:site-specific DNA recombinase